MPRFVVYEVWTRASIVEAENLADAYSVGAPESSKDQPIDGLSLCNWHVVPIEEK